MHYYGVTPNGNFLDPHTGFAGTILHSVERTATPPAAVERGRAALLARRNARVRPGLDDKVLLGWNALFLSALTEAAAALGRDDWMDAARTNARFLLRELRRDDGRFLRSWHAPYLAYAEDYAALLEALLTLAELDGTEWLAEARVVADELLRLFHDAEGGGFFTTGHDAEALVVRAKDLFDDATPSANSLAANGLLRLAALTGDGDYAPPAVAILELLADPMTRAPDRFRVPARRARAVVAPADRDRGRRRPGRSPHARAPGGDPRPVGTRFGHTVGERGRCLDSAARGPAGARRSRRPTCASTTRVASR